jgi:carboxypeptidase Q
MHRSNRRLLLVLASVVLVFLSGVRAQDALEPVELDKKILAAAKDGSEIMTNLAYLSDVIGPRLTGSAALKRANDWTAARMTSYGLTNVHLEAWEMPLGWERGTANARIVEPDNGRSLAVAAMGWTPGTNGKVEGDVVTFTAKNKEELAAYKGKLKNAIVLNGAPRSVTPINERPMAGAAPFQRGQFPNQDFRRELNEFFKTEGVAVILLDAAKPQGLLNMTGSWRGMDRVNAAEGMPTLFVAHEHYALLHRLAARPAPAKTRVEVEITNKFIPGPIAVYNTVGEIRGREKPDEVVVVGAHLDSWDLGTGTTDNGTGTSIVLETARILAKCGVAPKRTIRFILFTGEEQGLHGSKNYVQQHKEELPKISAAVVHDVGTGKVTGLAAGSREVLKPILEAELVSLKDLGVTEFGGRGMGGGSDHASFEQAGVPGLLFTQDMSEYRFTHHSQSDTFDKAHEPELIQGAQSMAVIAMRFANLDKLLPREKKAQP